MAQSPPPPFDPSRPPLIEGFTPTAFQHTEEGFGNKFLRKTRENPLVPIGEKKAEDHPGGAGEGGGAAALPNRKRSEGETLPVEFLAVAQRLKAGDLWEKEKGWWWWRAGVPALLSSFPG